MTLSRTNHSACFQPIADVRKVCALWDAFNPLAEFIKRMSCWRVGCGLSSVPAHSHDWCRKRRRGKSDNYTAPSSCWAHRCIAVCGVVAAAATPHECAAARVWCIKQLVCLLALRGPGRWRALHAGRSQNPHLAACARPLTTHIKNTISQRLCWIHASLLLRLPRRLPSQVDHLYML